MLEQPGADLLALASEPEAGGRLRAFRAPLYSADGPGYVVVKNVLEESVLRHLQTIWRAPELAAFSGPRSNVEAGPPAPPYRLDGPFQQSAWIWGPWNEPYCAVTHAVCWGVQHLRNRLQGQPPWFGLAYPHQAWMQTRVVHTLDGEGFVREHADYAEAPPATPLGRHHADPTMLQATLLLSTAGRDWTGEGFWVCAEGADERTLLASPPLAEAGDLLLWRHSLRHGVGEVRTPAGGLGFLRILLPIVLPGPR